ncbi:MAG TPA: OmpA family protein, partial [Conexibacter sp.]|nr:OmpA family protein [Conexibacter sp.]
ARPRLSASVGGGGAAVVVGDDGSVRLRCALAGAALRGCAAVATAIDGEALGGGAVRAGVGGRAATVAVRLDAGGRARLASALGGVRAVVTVTATTRDGRKVVKRLRVTLLAKRQQVVTQAGAFAPDGAALTPAGAAFLRDVARRLRGVRAIVCTGFTATRGEQGSDAAADALGLARGRAACALLRRLGVEVRLSAHSGGRSAPLAGNDSEFGRDRNRRVELTIVR